ncbi:hypothetical protein AYO22_10620 [Fonsecaea multimorphosa]|nr:hypothetical protein AYO22_10620 [Fonsecaea multimorphosa]
MAFLPTESSWNEGLEELELCGHVARGRDPAQSPIHSSIHDAGCSPSEHFYNMADGGAGLELDATALEEAKTDLVDVTQSPRDLEPVHVSNPREAFDLPNTLKDHSTSHNDTWNYLDRLDNHIHFVTKVKKIRQQRQKVQALRIQARDERSRMKHTRDRLQEAFGSFLEASGTMLSLGNGYDSATVGLREMESTFRELEAQDIDLDIVESTLVPAEWELKESEQQLYEDILGSSASDGSDSEIGVQLIKKIPESLHDIPKTHDVNVSLSPEYEPTSQERLSALARQRQEVTDRLLSLTNEYAALQEDVQMRTAVGLPVDEFSQEALAAFPKRRAQLLRELADLTTGHNTLSNMVAEGSDLTSKESDTLFGHDQFNDLLTDAAMSLPSLTEGDEALHLQARDYEERNNDMVPFLSQPILDAMLHNQGREEQSLVSPFAQYTSAAWDLRGRGPELLSAFVSMWIVGCLQSSWWSLIRFISIIDLDGKLPIETFVEYINRTLFQGDNGYNTHPYLSEDPERSGFSCTLEDEIFTPLSGATDKFNQELQWKTRPLKRRHSSGYSAATIHRKLSNHTYPKTD